MLVEDDGLEAVEGNAFPIAVSIDDEMLFASVEDAEWTFVRSSQRATDAVDTHKHVCARLKSRWHVCLAILDAWFRR